MSGGFWGGSAPSSGPERAGGGPSRRHTPYPAQPKAPAPAPANLPDIAVRCKAKSWQAEVSWEWSTASSSVEWSWWVTVAETAAPESASQAEVPSWRRQMKLRVKTGKWYKVTVEARSDAGTALARGEGSFKSVFDREELLMLYDKCVQYAGPRIERFRVFYRHKPRAYWDNIAFNRNHVMEKYIKDLNGQEASPINDVIYGLFFSANLLNGRIPNSSPFGDIRMLVQPSKLFSPKHKLYFADFYCNFVVHYMTVVVCEAGSETDGYCSKALIPLDPLNNPFLKIDVLGPDNYQYWVNTGLWVEVYFTENVPTGWASDWESAVSRGKSKPGGLANNKDCAVCNLYPGGVYPDEEAGQDEAGPATAPVPDVQERREAEELATGVESRQTSGSTFHLVMEMERAAEGKRKKVGQTAPPNLDTLDLIFELVDSVIAEVGPRIPLPAPGHAGRPADAGRAKAVEDLPQAPRNVVEITLDLEDEAEAAEEAGEAAAQASAKVKEEPGGEGKTEEGRSVLQRLDAANRRLDADFKALGRMLTAVQDSIAALQKKTRFLPKLPKTE